MGQDNEAEGNTGLVQDNLKVITTNVMLAHYEEMHLERGLGIPLRPPLSTSPYFSPPHPLSLSLLGLYSMIIHMILIHQ